MSEIDCDIPKYKKKSKAKGKPRSDHKHTYETVLLTVSHDIFTNTNPTKVCTICGYVGKIDLDPSYYTVTPNKILPYHILNKELSEKALSLPKWHQNYFDTFAKKSED